MYRLLILLTFLILLADWARGQTLTRRPSETLAQFVERTKPQGSQVTHDVLETRWNRDTVIVAFYEMPLRQHLAGGDCRGCREIAVDILVKRGNMYHRIAVDTITQAGGNPRIDAYFFANADTDSDKELVIIASWFINHRYIVSGTLYQTLIFDTPRYADAKLRYLEELSDSLSGGCDCYWEDEDRSRTAPYKTAADVRRGLRAQGFR